MVDSVTPRTLIVRAPLFPSYTELASAIRAFTDESVKDVRETINAIWEHTGTPQNPVDWSDPDTWIQERLSGKYQAIARKIWEVSKGTLNPRHVYGCYLFINRLKLLDQEQGLYRLRDRGHAFLSNDETLLRHCVRNFCRSNLSNLNTL
jgi:restriction system protein